MDSFSHVGDLHVLLTARFELHLGVVLITVSCLKPVFHVAGNLPSIVSSGEGGFIPMRFVKGSTVQMSGHSKHQYSSKSQS